MKQRNPSLMTTGFGKQRGLTPSSLMMHDFKDAWNEVSGPRRKCRAASRSDTYRSLGTMTSVFKSRTADNFILQLRHKLAGDSVNPSYSTFQQIQNER